MSTNRATGVTGKIIDSAKLGAWLETYMSVVYGVNDEAELSAYSIDALLLLQRQVNGHNEYAAVLEEGVGYQAEGTENLVPLPIRHGYTLGFLTAYIHPDVLASMASESEQDLASWVRTFGSRLESNFGIWYRWAS